jgi:hypothetical protein
MYHSFEEFKRREKTGESFGALKDQIFDAIINQPKEESDIWNSFDDEVKGCVIYNSINIAKSKDYEN